MTLYLMRHGETDYNQQSRFYGSTDVPLNPRGIEQALEIRNIIKGISVQKVYVSSLSRTQQTAELIFGTQVALEKLTGLDEKSFGLWEGLTADEIEEQFPEVWQAWLESPFEVTPPQAECFSDFQERVFSTIETLALQDTNQNVAIVGHLGVLRLIYQKFVNKESIFWDIHFPQGQVTCFEKDAEGHWYRYDLSHKGKERK